MRNVTITVGRFGERAKKVKVPVGATLGQLLKAADIKLSAPEKIWIDGARSQLGKKVEKGDIINIVGAREGGR